MKTEIFATFGPACGEESLLKAMIDAGMTGMRLNLSHTTLPESGVYIKRYQAAANACGVKPQILIDMQGPELRVGTLKEPFILKETVELVSQECYERNGGSVDYVPVPREVISVAEKCDKLLIDDGKMLLEIISVYKDKLEAAVLRGGLVKSGKSIKIKDKNIKMPALTAHDIENIKLAKEYGVTALMQPFVLSGDDLKYVRSVLKEHGAEDIQIFAKIENQLGVANIDDIIPESDVIIIARGDLGNDMPLWKLPRVQKYIEAACKKQGTPYVVVTQMLASMEEHPVPTRAEVSDIYHAVYHGAWGVMVTGETAVGKYPVETITYLANTAREAEDSVSYLESRK